MKTCLIEIVRLTAKFVRFESDQRSADPTFMDLINTATNLYLNDAYFTLEEK